MEPEAARGELIIQRPKLAWLDVLRGYRVVVDGQDLGRVDNGEEKSFLVAAGSHRVQVRIDWTGSPTLEVHVDPGAAVVVEVRLRGNLFSRHGYLALSRL